MNDEGETSVNVTNFGILTIDDDCGFERDHQNDEKIHANGDFEISRKRNCDPMLHDWANYIPDCLQKHYEGLAKQTDQ
jgi:hypothetical protein